MSVFLELDLPHGRLVGLELREPDPAALHPDERRALAELRGARRTSFIGGRLAAARALQAIGAAGAVAVGPRGRPEPPPGFAVSISHKPPWFVALARSGERPSIGVDVEELAPARPEIERHVLTERERAGLPGAGEARWRAILRAFSAKESVYKAIERHVGRFVGFHEVEVSLDAGGGVADLSGLPELGAARCELAILGEPGGRPLLVTSAALYV